MSNPYPLNEYGQPAYGYNNNNYQQNPYNMPYPPPPPISPPPPLPPGNIYQVPPSPVIIVENYSQELPCPFCGTQTQTYPMKKPGGVTYLWCCCLFWFTGFLCCIPFCIDSCQDTHLICMRCNNPKRVVPANCC